MLVQETNNKDMSNIEHRMMPNVFHSDKWLFTFTNIPTLSNDVDMQYFTTYIKTITLPDYSTGEHFKVQAPFGMQHLHPAGGMQKNQNLGQLIIEYKASEDLFNYFTFWQWIQNLRYGNVNTSEKTRTEAGMFFNYVISRGALTLLDNQKRPVSKITFSKMLINTLGHLTLESGSTNEFSFTVTFDFEEMEYNFLDVMTGAVNPSAPVLISPVCNAFKPSIAPVPTTVKWGTS